MKARTARKIESPTGRPKTFKTRVSSPTVPGAVEEVDRVIDSIEHLRQRRNLDPLAFRSAEKLRAAHDVIYGSIGGVMDMDRVRGTSNPGAPPAPAFMLAAETLS